MNKKLIRLTESDLHRVIKESVKKVLREWDDEYPTYQDDDGNAYEGNYYFNTNDFKKIKHMWVLESKYGSEAVFSSSQEAAEYAIALLKDADRESNYFDEEEAYRDIMKQINESNFQEWECGGYYSNMVDFVEKK